MISGVKLWLEATRPATLWASFVPVLVGVSWVSTYAQPKAWIVMCTFVTALLIQIGTNFVNDYKDAQTGADGDDRLGPRRATASGLIHESKMKRAAFLVLALATVGGSLLIAHGGWPIALIGVASLICAVAYTAGPIPLAYVGLGDVFVLLFFGIVAVSGTEYLLTTGVSLIGFLFGLAIGCISTCILVVNNLRDIHSDRRAKKRTLAVRFGQGFVRVEYVILLVIAHGSLAIVPLIDKSLSPLWLTFVITVPLSWINARAVWKLEGRALNPYLGKTALLELVTGFCISGVCLWSI